MTEHLSSRLRGVGAVLTVVVVMVVLSKVFLAYPSWAQAAPTMVLFTILIVVADLFHPAQLSAIATAGISGVIVAIATVIPAIVLGALTPQLLLAAGITTVTAFAQSRRASRGASEA